MRENSSKEVTIKSGLPTGVRKKGNSYESNIKINGKTVYLGSFKNIDLASKSYQNALNKLL
jgi:hypothetical protein